MGRARFRNSFDARRVRVVAHKYYVRAVRLEIPLKWCTIRNTIRLSD